MVSRWGTWGMQVPRATSDYLSGPAPDRRAGRRGRKSEQRGLRDRRYTQRDISGRAAGGAGAGGDCESEKGRSGRGRRSGRRGRSGISGRGIHGKGSEGPTGSQVGFWDRGHHYAGFVLRGERYLREVGSRADASRSGADRISAAARIARGSAGNRRYGGDFFFGRADAAYHARAEYGRAFIDGHGLRI